MDTTLLRRWLTGFWLLLALLALVIFCFRLNAVVRQGASYVTTGFEDISIYNISRIRHGEPVYVDCFTYPYRASLFNWLFYQVYGGTAMMLNPSENMLPLVLRLVTLAFALTGAAVTFAFLASRGRQPPEGEHTPDGSLSLRGLTPPARLMLASYTLVIWCAPLIGWWSLTVRPDIPAVTCELLGLLLVARGGPRLSWPAALLAGVLFFLAWSFKQSAIGLCAGTMLALALRREWANLLRIGATTGVLTALVLAIALPQPAYVANLFAAPALAPMENRQLGVILFGITLAWGPLLFIAPAIMLLGQTPEERRALVRRPVAVLTVATLAALVVNVLAARRPGCSGNYFFETWLAGMTLGGMVQVHVLAHGVTFARRLDRWLFLGFTGLVLAFSVQSVVTMFDPFHKPDTQMVERMLRLPRPPYSEELLTALRTSPKPLFCDDSLLTIQALGADAGDVPAIDHTIYWDAGRAGKLSQPDIRARIAQREYENIWLYVRRTEWEPFVRQAGYVVTWEDGDYRQFTKP